MNISDVVAEAYSPVAPTQLLLRIELASFAFGIRVLNGCSVMRAERRSNNL